MRAVRELDALHIDAVSRHVDAAILSGVFMGLFLVVGSQLLNDNDHWPAVYRMYNESEKCKKELQKMGAQVKPNNILRMGYTVKHASPCSSDQKKRIDELSEKLNSTQSAAMKSHFKLIASSALFVLGAVAVQTSLLGDF